MKQPIENLFKRYEGDLEAMAVLAYLGSFITPDRAHVLSLRDIEKKTGFGRRKLRAILERLSSNESLSYIINRYGTRVVLNSIHLCSFDTSILSTSVAPKEDLAKRFGIIEKSRIDLTQNLRFLQSDYHLASSLNCYKVTHSLDSLSSAIIANMISDKTKLDDKTDTSKGEELQASTEVSLLPANRSRQRESLSKIPRKEKKALKKESKAKEKSLGALIWDAYTEEYESVYDVTPPSNAPNYSITKRLGQQLGVDAIEVVRFYVHHKDAYYIKNRHDIRYALHGANRLYIDWKKGTGITAGDAKLLENRDRNQKVFDQVEVAHENELGNMNLID